MNAAQEPLDFCRCDHDAVIDLALSGAIFVHRLNLHTLTEKWYIEYLTKKNRRMQIF